MKADRVSAILGSLGGNFFLFGAVIAGWPGLPPWTPAHGHSGNSPSVIQLSFIPYIVDASGGGWPGHRAALCPRPEIPRWQFELYDAPLPSGYDPNAWTLERRYACVRVSKEGRVLDVSLIGVSEPELANALTKTVRRHWLFSPRYEQDQGWARVRINAGPPEPPAMPAQPLY